MESVINSIRKNLQELPVYMLKLSPVALGYKPGGIKWSKKEILGHLTDSAINNLQRFTEIQYEKTPYTIRQYKQDQLVNANDYQRMELIDILDLWKALNQQIIWVIAKMTTDQLGLEILTDGKKQTLEWLIRDYVVHLEHHINQIMEELN